MYNFISDGMRPFYDLATDDGLRLHVTAKYKADPLTTKTFDADFSFRRVPMYDQMEEVMLCGDWIDGDGNSWSFFYTPDEAESEDLSSAEFTFTMTSADGMEYSGRSVYFSQNNSSGVVTVQFSFEEFSSPKYQSITLESDSITFTSDEGVLVLIRK